MFHVKRPLFALCLLFAPLAWPASVEVRIPGADVELVGRLYRPKGAGPLPAVVMMHGCSGMWQRDGTTPTANYRFWAEHFQGRGYAALLLDSFGPRRARDLYAESPPDPRVPAIGPATRTRPSSGSPLARTSMRATSTSWAGPTAPWPFCRACVPTRPDALQRVRTSDRRSPSIPAA